MIRLGTRISLLLSISLFSSVAIVLLIVWISTFRFVTQQLNRDLKVGVNVLEQALIDRERMLVESAEILTADFGFRRTVATNDVPTIHSVLENHKQRIDADLMAILDLNSRVTVSAGQDISKMSNAFISARVKSVISQGSLSDFVLIGERLYQIVIVSVNAPRPIAIAMIGFEMDSHLAGKLQATTGLQISFHAKNNVSRVVLSTLGRVSETWLEESIKNHFKHIPFVRTGQHRSSKYALASTPEQKVNVFLSKSLDEIYQEFDSLQLKIVIVSLMTIPFSLLAAFLFSKNITRPIESLGRVAKSIA